MQWKNWSPESFGALSPQENAYFKAEIKNTQLKSIQTVLEIGFGNGAFLTYAKAQGWDVTGTEINEELIKVARTRRFSVFQAQELPTLPKNHFDLIAMFDVLEHIPQETIIPFLTQLRTMLKSDGILLAKFPNGDSPLGLPNQHGDITHITTLGSIKVLYLSKTVKLTPIYLGKSADPILCGSTPHILHKLVTTPLKAILEGLIKPIFFPCSKITIFSTNITVAWKKEK